MVTYRGLRRTTGRMRPADRLWVYSRGGKPCRKCGDPDRIAQKGRRRARHLLVSVVSVVAHWVTCSDRGRESRDMHITVWRC